MSALPTTNAPPREDWPNNPDDYDLREEVGVSTHGVVRRALCLARQDEEVAIKVVNLDTLVGEGEVDRELADEGEGVGSEQSADRRLPGRRQ